MPRPPGQVPGPEVPVRPEVVRLEKMLGRFGYRPPVKRMPKRAWWLAVAAALMLALAVPRLQRGKITEWKYAAGTRPAEATDG